MNTTVEKSIPVVSANLWALYRKEDGVMLAVRPTRDLARTRLQQISTKNRSKYTIVKYRYENPSLQ